MRHITELAVAGRVLNSTRSQSRQLACASPQRHILLSLPKRSCVAAAATTFPFSS